MIVSGRLKGKHAEKLDGEILNDKLGTKSGNAVRDGRGREKANAKGLQVA